jgi:hypothetical protein
MKLYGKDPDGYKNKYKLKLKRIMEYYKTKYRQNNAELFAYTELLNLMSVCSCILQKY